MLMVTLSVLIGCVTPASADVSCQPADLLGMLASVSYVFTGGIAPVSAYTRGYAIVHYPNQQPDMPGLDQPRVDAALRVVCESARRRNVATEAASAQRLCEFVMPMNAATEVTAKLAAVCGRCATYDGPRRLPTWVSACKVALSARCASASMQVPATNHKKIILSVCLIASVSLVIGRVILHLHLFICG